MLLNDQLESPLLISPQTPPSPKPVPEFSEKCPVCGRTIQSSSMQLQVEKDDSTPCKNCENIVPKNVLRRGSKISREQIRTKVINEIINSEKTFVSHLNDVIQVNTI